MLGQALNLINGPTIAGAIDEPNNRLSQLVASEKDDGRLIDEMFLRVLNRPPKPAEDRRQRRKHCDRSTTTMRKLVAKLADYEKTLPAKQAEWENTARPARSPGFRSKCNRPSRPSAPRWRRRPNDVDLRLRQARKGHVHDDRRKPICGHHGFPPGGSRRSALAARRGLAARRTAIKCSANCASPPRQAADPSKSQPVVLQNAQADYSQPGWDVTGAIDGDLATGWAIDEAGRPRPRGDVRMPRGHRLLRRHAAHVHARPATIPTAITCSANSACRPAHRKRPFRLEGLPANIARLLAIPPPSGRPPSKPS